MVILIGAGAFAKVTVRSAVKMSSLPMVGEPLLPHNGGTVLEQAVDELEFAIDVGVFAMREYQLLSIKSLLYVN